MDTHPAPKYGSKDLPPASRVVSAIDVELESGRLHSHDDGAGQLKVQFNLISMAALCYVTMSTWAAWAGTMVTCLYSGGPAGMFFGFLVVWVCSLCSSASLGEMASIWPDASGQILWVERLSPPSIAKFMRFYTGYLTALGHIFFSAASAFVFSTLVTAFAILCNPDYVNSRWQTTLICWCVIGLALVFNLYGVRFFTLLNTATAILGVTTLLSLIVVMLTMSSHRNSATYAFTEFINATGWDNSGIVFILGLVTAAFSMIGYDCIAHMSEEMHDPARDAPRAMVGAILMSGVTGISFIVTVLFTLQDPDGLATTTTGFPYLAMLFQVTQSIPGSVFLALATLACAPVAVIMIMASSGRILMSFAREGGLPFSSFFAKVDKRKQLPINALCFSAGLQALLVLIYIGNTALFNSLLVLTVAALNISYAIPNGLMLFRARRLGLPKAPFSLGRLGTPINAIALSYNIVISFFLFFPNYLPVTALNMNYASAIFGLVHLIMGIYWFCGGKQNVRRFAAERARAEGSKSSNISLEA
ncbi:amino acid/polyamine transporter I [Leucosporidium creatinivorum]|uniref:Amino acid/polyamine transporter I n=1 Tax=Leucosporidium creatinivorum TaxID=106004 RepID=A0A1Y2G3T0_9BASI|nr:amino acid/polyamine transporter I [Leucosporidium creatinivorum]